MLIHLKTWMVGCGVSLALFASPAFSQKCKPNKDATAPTQNFTVHSNGTVTHSITGLMWKVCAEGQEFSLNNGAPTCTGKTTPYTWNDALAHAKKSEFAYHKDWRLPSVDELKGIAELTCMGPAINVQVFPNTYFGTHWTSTTNESDAYFAWGVGFLWGTADEYKNKLERHRLRLVR